MSAFDNRDKDDLLYAIRTTYEEMGLDLREFVIVLFEILAYFVEYAELAPANPSIHRRVH